VRSPYGFQKDEVSKYKPAYIEPEALNDWIKSHDVVRWISLQRREAKHDRLPNTHGAIQSVGKPAAI